jgi:hypothetical protein
VGLGVSPVQSPVIALVINNNIVVHFLSDPGSLDFSEFSPSRSLPFVFRLDLGRWGHLDQGRGQRNNSLAFREVPSEDTGKTEKREGEKEKEREKKEREKRDRRGRKREREEREKREREKMKRDREKREREKRERKEREERERGVREKGDRERRGR